MALDSSKRIEENKVEIKFTIARDVFDAAVDAQFKKNLKNIQIPGFRKGKAPRGMVEKMYGKGVFYEDALNDVVPAALEEAIVASKENAISRPEVDVDEIADDGIHMKATFYVKPEVKLGEYKGLEAIKVTSEAKDEDVDAEIQRVRERNSRTIDVTDRAAKDGDTVKIDYEGSVDGVKFDGGTAKDQSLKLGSHTFIDTYEEQIVGHNIGDEFDVNVSFPENYGEASLSGKAAVFKVKLNAIAETEYPELDDEFAKDVSDFDTLADYKADIKANLQKRLDASADNATDNELIEALLGVTTVEIPEPMVATEVENIVREQDYSMRSQGLSLDMYLKYTQSTLDDMKKSLEPQATRRVKTRLALEKVAEIEKLVATEEDLEAEYKKNAEIYSMEIEKVKEALPAEYLKEDIAVNKAVEFIKNNAKITVKTAEEYQKEQEKKAKAKVAAKKEDAAEKKTTAKKTTTKAADGEKKATTAKKTTTKTADGEKKATTAKKAPAKKADTDAKTEKKPKAAKETK